MARRRPLTIVVHWFGKAGAGPLQPALDDYAARIQRSCRLELRPHRSGDSAEREARDIASALSGAAYVALHPAGRSATSAEILDLLRNASATGDQTLRFVLGGAPGLHADVVRGARLAMSLSPLTLPHDLARLVLLEQIYRGLSTLDGSPYAR